MTKQDNTITITARTSFINTSPRKANLVLKSIVGQAPQVAIDRLQFAPQRAAKPVIKLLQQALGNAADQYKLTSSDLIISQAFATKASASRRVRFAGRGRVQPYYKTTSHLTIVLQSKLKPAPQPAKASDKKVSTSKTKTASKETTKKSTKKTSKTSKKTTKKTKTTVKKSTKK